MFRGTASEVAEGKNQDPARRVSYACLKLQSWTYYLFMNINVEKFETGL